MSQSISNGSRVPPGFRFHPTEEELLHYYLRKKLACEEIDLDVILEIDLNKLEPWDIEEKCKIGSNPQNEWYFFSRKDKKYPTGTRTNRATTAGFWKATGRDKVIYNSYSTKRIGMRKTLVFYMGRAPRGQKSDWIMHEYRLEENINENNNSLSNYASSSVGETGEEDGWVVCRVFKKKNLFKAPENKESSSMAEDDDGAQMLQSSSTRDGALDKNFQYMKGSWKMEAGSASNTRCKTYLPELSSDGLLVIDMEAAGASSITHQRGNMSSIPNQAQEEPTIRDWATVDRLVASHLNGQSDSFKQLDFFNTSNLLSISDQYHLQTPLDCNNDVDLWNFNP